jgi:hypothetical protein
VAGTIPCTTVWSGFVAAGGQLIVAAALGVVLRATLAAVCFAGSASLSSLTKCPVTTSPARTAMASPAATSPANRMSCQRSRITAKFGRLLTDSRLRPRQEA